jgi:hypothetical protein
VSGFVDIKEELGRSNPQINLPPENIEEVAMDVWGFLSVVAVCVTIALAPLVWSRIK